MKYVNVSEKAPWDGGSGGAMLGLGLSLPQSLGKGGGWKLLGGVGATRVPGEVQYGWRLV